MDTHLSRILDGVREDLASRKSRRPYDELVKMADIRGPATDLVSTVPRVPAVIAEIKRASPSRGWIRRDLDAVVAAKAYIEGGAWAISILTEERLFGGSLSDLARVRWELPYSVLLRKDFLLDEYMLAESRAYGADMALLMVSVLGERNAEMAALARKHRLEPLVEGRDEAEMESAAKSGANFIGINNRDRATLEVDLSTSARLLPLVPEGAIAVVESGISGPEQVERFHRMGARLFLVGESLVTSGDPADTLRRYVGK